MAKTTADLLIERLQEWGVDTIFGFPGDGITDIFEALRTHQDSMRFVQVRHEEAAAFAACGYAKYTGRLGAKRWWRTFSRNMCRRSFDARGRKPRRVSAKNVAARPSRLVALRG